MNINADHALYYSPNELAILLVEYAVGGDFKETQNRTIIKNRESITASVIDEALKRLGYIYPVNNSLQIITLVGATLARHRINDPEGGVEWCELILPKLAEAVANRF